MTDPVHLREKKAMEPMNNTVNVIGAGLAGCEAAFQIAKRGTKVNLYEMKPRRFSPAHHSEGFAELVCSNSLRSNDVTNAVGLLKEEMRRIGSVIMEAADATAVPAGSALAVDRELFSKYITDKIENDPNITVIREELTDIPDNGITVIASGPLTSEALSQKIAEKYAKDSLHFFDAVAPIVDASTIDMNKAFYASRYGKGEACYINCPMTEGEYDAFYNELVGAKEAELKDFDKEAGKDPTVFEGCMPVEVMARRGKDTLLFGPLKPVGLPNPITGEEYHAVVQLRQENAAKTMYNLVGFQTHLTFPEQKRVFSMIPGLENADFLRYGVMHRNTFINSPKLLDADYSLRVKNTVFFAGQITGVEGYVESAASGLVAGINAAMRAMDKSSFLFPATTVIGAMSAYISDKNIANFQPMNANFGLIEPLGYKVKGGKRKRYEEYSVRSLKTIDELITQL